MDPQFLDPATLPDGTPVTMVAEVTGVTTDRLDEAEYRYPTMDIKHLYIWKDDPQSYPQSRAVCRVLRRCRDRRRQEAIGGGIGIGTGSRPSTFSRAILFHLRILQSVTRVQPFNPLPAR